MGRRGRREGVSIWGRTNTRERARGANFFDRIRVLLNDFEICEALRCERAHQEPFHKTFCHKQPVEDRHKTMHKTALSEDRKSTRLNSSHGYISYAVFCLKKKKQKEQIIIVYNTQQRDS